MDTFQRTISIIEKEMAKNITFLQKAIDTRNTNNSTVALINSLQQTVLMMMKRTTEQITDVSRGNTAALVGIEQFLSKLGTLTTAERAHNTADDGKHPFAKITVKSKDRRDSIRK